MTRSRSRSLGRSRSPDRRSRSPRRDSRPRSASVEPHVTTTITVGNLTKNVNEGHIKEIFGTYGKIKSIHFPMNARCNYYSLSS